MKVYKYCNKTKKLEVIILRNKHKHDKPIIGMSHKEIHEMVLRNTKESVKIGTNYE